jgi:hypothetical protein
MTNYHRRKNKKIKNIFTDYFDDLKDKRDYNGINVYFEETGEKLGFIKETLFNENKDVIAYKIKNETTGAELKFPKKQFCRDKRGFILMPSWYITADEALKKIEFIDKTYPEMQNIVTDDKFDDELLNIFLMREDEYRKDAKGKYFEYINETKKIYKMLLRQIKTLENKRYEFKNDLWDLTTNRLIEQIDRKTYAEKVEKIKRKVNLLNLNINKCKDLLERLDKTCLGKISKNLYPTDDLFSYDFNQKNNAINLENDDKIDEMLANLINKRITKDIKKYLIKIYQSEETETKNFFYNKEE